MGFYSNSTPGHRRINELTGDIELSEDFKKEIEKREIPLYKGYGIQKRLFHEADTETLKTREDVDRRIMELLVENTKNGYTSNYASKSNSLKGNSKIPLKGQDLEEDKMMELLNKVSLQNEKIINQNKIILQELRKLGE